ncbi:hypothetical protein QAD02_022054, partial [Eretmocerus hayati]
GNMQTRSRKKMRDIDSEQPETVEKHFKLIMEDTSYIDSEISQITPKDLPAWFSEELFRAGQNYFKRNLLGFNGGYLAGLIAVFLVPSISEILVSTNQSSTACTAFKRYFQTLLHIYNLHIHDFKDPESRFYRSLNTIRWKHAMSSKFSLKKNQTGITQRDMVLTQFGFIGYILTKSEDLSLTNQKEERDAINHFWRVVGHLLGISDRLNLCRKDVDESTHLCALLLRDVFKSHLKDPSEHFFSLTKTAIEGMQSIDPFVDIDGFLTFFYELNESKYEKRLSIYSRLNYAYRRTNFYLL